MLSLLESQQLKTWVISFFMIVMLALNGSDLILSAIL